MKPIFVFIFLKNKMSATTTTTTSQQTKLDQNSKTPSDHHQHPDVHKLFHINVHSNFFAFSLRTNQRTHETNKHWQTKTKFFSFTFSLQTIDRSINQSIDPHSGDIYLSLPFLQNTHISTHFLSSLSFPPFNTFKGFACLDTKYYVLRRSKIVKSSRVNNRTDYDSRKQREEKKRSKRRDGSGSCVSLRRNFSIYEAINGAK